MDDKKIIELLFLRDESAIEEAKTKYSLLCRNVSMRILRNREDSLECENDTYLKLWNTVPPNKPSSLKNYISLLSRSISLDLYRKKHAEKRSGHICESFNELEECIPESREIYENLEERELGKLISDFLRTKEKEERNVFILRYRDFYSIKEIAKKYGFSQSKVKMMLKRTREKLRTYLEKEGVFV